MCENDIIPGMLAEKRGYENRMTANKKGGGSSPNFTII